MAALFARERAHLVRSRLVLFATPLALGFVELGHPVLNVTQTIHQLRPFVVWWIVLHLLLAPLLAGMAWAFFLLLDGVRGPVAWTGRLAACGYALLAIVYEAAVGLVSGVITLDAVSLSPQVQSGIQSAHTRLLLSPLFDRMAICIILLGGVAVAASVLALVRAGAPRWAALLFCGSFCFALAHENPFGPLGNACFLSAALCLELLWSGPPRERGRAVEVSALPASTSAVGVSGS